MSQIYQPKPDNRKYFDLIQHIKNGAIKIPKFQREFVWEIEQSAKLLDSILKGYPIGTFIIWKTKHRLNNIKNLGGVNLPESPTGDYIQYVLDGQQRLASLFVAIEGLKINKGNNVIDYNEIFIDLTKDKDDSDQIVTSEKPENQSIKIYDLLNGGSQFFVDNYKEHLAKIDFYRLQFETYAFSAIDIVDYPIDKAVDVFTRINTTGKSLSLFEIMVATTYDEKTFDLAEKYEKLSKELNDVDYEIPDAALLQCISLNLVGDCTRKTILSLKKQDIIDCWDDVVNSIKDAVDYFQIEFQIPVSKILPYRSLIVPFSYFFYNHKSKPTPEQSKLLEEYFWDSSLTYRFQSAHESKLAQDSKKMDDIINNKRPLYDQKSQPNLAKEHIRDYWFSTGDSFCKAILCLFSSLNPRSFNTNRPVKLDNSWLVTTNSKNYHHFFPKSFLSKNMFSETQQNVISNITIVDDFLNKAVIRAKAPSDYMKNFQTDNPELSETMKTHLIDDLTNFGIMDDNYGKFLDKRSERIVDELQKKLHR